MREPERSRFVALLQGGAAARDIHDTSAQGGYDSDAAPRLSDAFLQRELQRVQSHMTGMCRLLHGQVGAPARIVDMGCGTGGGTVALALAHPGAVEVIGLDASQAAIDAARVRAQAHDLPAERVRFECVVPGASLPVAAASADLVTCVSMIEFVSGRDERARLLTGMLGMLRPGGYLYLATPSPWRLRELHSRRWLGNQRRIPGFPWASPPRMLRAMLPGAATRTLASERMRLDPRLRPVAWAAPMVAWAFAWQYLLARKA